MSLLIVAGFHRSGTSLLAQLLSRAGLFMGDELMAAHASNLRGHVEDLEVVRIHDRILAANGRTWQVERDFIPVVDDDVWQDMASLVEAREDRPLWGFKDPRVCLFLPLWKHLVPEAKILATFRHPVACVDSLERRHARDLAERRGRPEDHWRFWTEPGHGLRLWRCYNRSLLRAVEVFRDDAMVVSMPDLQQDVDVVGALNRRWRLGLDPVRPAEVYDERLTTADAGGEPGAPVPGYLEPIWQRLNELAAADRHEPVEPVEPGKAVETTGSRHG